MGNRLKLSIGEFAGKVKSTVVDNAEIIKEEHASYSPSSLEERFNQFLNEDNDLGQGYPPVIIVFGPTGIGKTQAIKEVISDLKEHGRNIIFQDLDLSQFSADYLRGYPVLMKDENRSTDVRFKIIPPSFIKEPVDKLIDEVKKFEEEVAKGNKNAEPPLLVFFSDNITNASEMHFQWLTGFIDKGATGDFIIPPAIFKKHIIFVCAGNDPKDSILAHDLPEKIIVRASMICDVTNPPEVWLNWARNSGIHASILSYINQNPSALYNFNEKKANVAIATPRTWEFLSKNIKRTEASFGIVGGDYSKLAGTPQWDEFIESITEDAQGSIGMLEGTKFATFFSYAKELPSVEEALINGKLPDFKSKIENAKSEDEVRKYNSMTLFFGEMMCNRFISDATNPKRDNDVIINEVKNFAEFITEKVGHLDSFVFMISRINSILEKDLLIFKTFAKNDKIMEFIKKNQPHLIAIQSLTR